ncbi:MAG: hypothetical protein JXD23_00900 [Spirochaetales bacterium]|nr:hypothetical protein [Spirochaetales bacterium]
MDKSNFFLKSCIVVVLLLPISCPLENPQPGQDLFFSSNWGDDSIMITEDILALADGATASPRVISGLATGIIHPGLDSLAVDKSRKLLYLANTGGGNMLVFQDLATITGNTPPVRMFSGTENIEEGIAVDSGRNRLYISTSSAHIWIFNNASTLSGSAVSPDAVIDQDVYSLFLDETNDRLYAASSQPPTYSIFVFDSAGTLASGAAPDRTITFPAGYSPTSIWVDAAHDRMYVGSQNSYSGNFLFVLPGASSLDGACDLGTAPVARIDEQSISLIVDNQDNLYAWADSALQVRIYFNASAISGDVAGPDKVIQGVVNHGYGMDYVPR